MSDRSVNIINALYGREIRGTWRDRLRGWNRKVRVKVEKHRREMRIRALYGDRNRILTRRRVAAAIIIVTFTALSSSSVVYYNRLTRMEQDVFKEEAKIASLLQRRHNISINLARTLRDYAVHEQAIFHHVSNVRASGRVEDDVAGDEDPALRAPDQKSAAKEASPGPSAIRDASDSETLLDDVIGMLEGSAKGDISLDRKLTGLLAVAESYPDLKLSENFRRFMEALVETEKELSYRRMEYSDVVNTYSTELMTYPGKLFANLYGFDQVPYFTADSQATRFQPVEY